MSCWLTIPSKRPPEEAEPVLKQWRERGYRVALFRDWSDPGIGTQVSYGQSCGDGIIELVDMTYPGYAVATNLLIGHVIVADSDAEWFICAGDDILPDPNHSAEEIAKECSQFFCRMGPRYGLMELDELNFPTFGVMQCTGDRWGIDPNSHAFISATPGCNACRCQVCGRGEIAPVHLTGAYIDRVAGSPWIGREFARRMYQGRGPYWPEYTHMGVDEELQAVAQKFGVFWQRSDLIHFHQHWGRAKEGEPMVSSERMPEFLKHANSPEEWKRYKRIFAERQGAGFPGSEPL